MRVCVTINWVWAGAKQSRASRREREGEGGVKVPNVQDKEFCLTFEFEFDSCRFLSETFGVLACSIPRLTKCMVFVACYIRKMQGQPLFLQGCQHLENPTPPWRSTLLAPTGALILTMVYYISAATSTFSDFHSVP